MNATCVACIDPPFPAACRSLSQVLCVLLVAPGTARSNAPCFGRARANIILAQISEEAEFTRGYCWCWLGCIPLTTWGSCAHVSR